MILQTLAALRDAPRTRRIRYPSRLRELSVVAVERPFPCMIRVTLSGADLADFATGAADDWLRLMVPGPDGTPVPRYYTPRRFDAARRELVIDLVDHAVGPAAAWARRARVGDRVSVGGPVGSAPIEGRVAHWLLIGDETALPAIGRRIEEMGPGDSVTSLVAVPSPADRQPLPTAARHEALWICRPAAEAARPGPLLEALQGIVIPPRCFVWLAAEAGVVRALRGALAARGVTRGWIRHAGYWSAG